MAEPKDNLIDIGGPTVQQYGIKDGMHSLNNNYQMFTCWGSS